MERLNTIQKDHRLNTPIKRGDEGSGGAHHTYEVYDIDESVVLATIIFQQGPRSDAEAQHGVLDEDLLEIVRDRLAAFQKGPYPSREGAIALTHVETALLWLSKRIDDRAARNVLGKELK